MVEYTKDYPLADCHFPSGFTITQGDGCVRDRSFLHRNFRGVEGKEKFQYYLLRFYGIITSYGSYYTDLSAPLPRCADSAEALAGIAAEWASYGSYDTDLSAPLPRCADSAEALAGIAAEWVSYGTGSPIKYEERMTACKIGKHQEIKKDRI